MNTRFPSNRRPNHRRMQKLQAQLDDTPDAAGLGVSLQGDGRFKLFRTLPDGTIVTYYDAELDEVVGVAIILQVEGVEAAASAGATVLQDPVATTPTDAPTDNVVRVHDSDPSVTALPPQPAPDVAALQQRQRLARATALVSSLPAFTLPAGVSPDSQTARALRASHDRRLAALMRASGVLNDRPRGNDVTPEREEELELQLVNMARLARTENRQAIAATKGHVAASACASPGQAGAGTPLIQRRAKKCCEACTQLFWAEELRDGICAKADCQVKLANWKRFQTSSRALSPA